jgi:hypothetical protein
MELIEVLGRASAEAVLRLSAEGIARLHGNAHGPHVEGTRHFKVFRSDDKAGYLDSTPSPSRSKIA